jgi:hypothetical protein
MTAIMAAVAIITMAVQQSHGIISTASRANLKCKNSQNQIYERAEHVVTDIAALSLSLLVHESAPWKRGQFCFFI